MGFLSTGPTGAEQQASGADEAQRTAMKHSAAAYSNYRQFDRDNYANQLSNRASLYQGMMNRMASAYGQQGSPNLQQMPNNPMSLAQTTVGATHGSNAAGNGVDFYGNGQVGNDPYSSQYKPDAYGLIGQMGLEGKGRYQGNDQFTGPGATLDSSGRPLAPNSINNINTNNYAPSAPAQQSGQSGGQFNFAPRRP